MEHIIGIENYNLKGNTAVTIGKFDALHRGHQLLIENVVRRKSLDEKAVAIIFSVSPRLALGKVGEEPKFIITDDERKKMFEDFGIDVLLELVFDEHTIKMEPEEFVKLLKNNVSMKYLCVGEDFRFGYKGRGDVSMLKAAGEKEGFFSDAVKKVYFEGEEISSTRIRGEISKGNIKLANEMLGYDFFIRNNVIHGRKIGRTINFPTINMVPRDEKLLPPFGVYATITEVSGKKVYGMTNIGVRPTIDEKNTRLTIETHLFDFHEDIYEKEAVVSFLDFIRPEKKFDSVESLKEQILRDQDEIKKRLKITS